MLRALNENNNSTSGILPAWKHQIASFLSSFLTTFMLSYIHESQKGEPSQPSVRPKIGDADTNQMLRRMRTNCPKWSPPHSHPPQLTDVSADYRNTMKYLSGLGGYNHVIFAATFWTIFDEFGSARPR